MMMKKIAMLALTMAAAVLSAIPAGADYIDGRKPDYYTDIRVNKPYLNFRVKAGEDVDISNMKFAISNSAGEKVATFTGADDTMNILDSNVLDFSNIHSAEDLKSYYYYLNDSKLSDPYTLDNKKANYPWGDLYNGDNYKHIDSDGKCYIRPDDNCYYYYIDPKKYEVVDTMTLPANTVLVDVSSEYATNGNTIGSLNLDAFKDTQKYELDYDNIMYYYHYAGKRVTYKADTGFYSVFHNNVSSNRDNCEVTNKPVKYSRVRVKFNEVFPDLADDDLIITTNNDFYNPPVSPTLKYNMRGVQKDTYFTAVYQSGSVFTASIPDKDGYIEFWLNDETMETVLYHNYYYHIEKNGKVYAGSGGDGRQEGQLPRSIEALRYKFEYPKGAYCLYGLKPDTYKLSIEDIGDSRDYRLSHSDIVITDTKDIQKADITVNKRPLLLGDVNRDGTIDVTDISIIAGYVKGIKKLDGRSPFTADCNQSGGVNITDVAAIAAHVKGYKNIPRKYI